MSRDEAKRDAEQAIGAKPEPLVDWERELLAPPEWDEVQHLADLYAEDEGKKVDGYEHVNHPPHYGGGDNPYEAIRVIEAWKLDFCLGNTVKYISRAGKKGCELQDLKKALWYLERRINQIEKGDG